MVIGNPTRTEESAIHGNRTERGALGTLAASREVGTHNAVSSSPKPAAGLRKWGEGIGKKMALLGKF